MHDKYLAIRDAIQQRTRLLARHRGLWLTLCPHVLGWRNDQPYLIAYAVGRKPQWLCLPMIEISYVRTVEGAWQPGPNGLRPPVEMELEMEVEVAAAEPAPVADEPGPSRGGAAETGS